MVRRRWVTQLRSQEKIQQGEGHCRWSGMPSMAGELTWLPESIQSKKTENRMKWTELLGMGTERDFGC